MENCIEKLEYLISLKKEKKAANKLERDDFANNWASLTEIEGFSERAEAFLYNGFTYCGAKPLKEYMKKQKFPISVLNLFFDGKLFGENCVNTTQILIHLLALYINDTQKDLEIIASIIQKLPNAIMNKEGKINEKIGGIIKKYFLDDIIPNAEFPEFVLLIGNGLDYTTAEIFVKQLNSIISLMDVTKYSKKCKCNMEKLKNWINFSKQEKMDDVLENSSNKIEEIEETQEKEEIKQTEETDSENKANRDIIECLTKDLEVALMRKTELENKIELIRKTNTDISNELLEVEKQLDSARNRIVENDMIVNTLEEENLKLKVKLEETLEANRLQKDEIEQRIELIEMLRRDRAKQEEEAQRRLVSKLRSYYEDYLDAEEIEMSLELGENMRDQIGEIFKILISSGMTMR